MNLSEQFASLVKVVEKVELERQQQLDAERRISETNRENGARAGLDDKRLLKRAVYQQIILDTLVPGDLMSSIAVGRAMGCGRLAAYQRLKVLEGQGLVLRIGTGVRTKWSKS